MFVEAKTAAETAIAELKEVIQGEDKEAIETKTAALTEVAGKIAEKAYAQSAEAEAGTEPEAENAQGEAGEEVVDAEFEEVKDDDKK